LKIPKRARSGNEPSIEELSAWPIPATGVGSVWDWVRLSKSDIVLDDKVMTWREMLAAVGLEPQPPPEFSLRSFELRGIHGKQHKRKCDEEH